MFEPMSQDETARTGLCPDCTNRLVHKDCGMNHTDCFYIECDECEWWESNCYGGGDDE